MIKKLLASLFVGAALSSVFFVGSVSAQTTQAQIDALLQQIAALQAQLLALQNNQGTQTTAPWCHTFNTNLGIGNSSNEVYQLGYALARDGIAGFEKYVILDGSTPYTETIASGVSAFQDKYRSEILTPNGLAFPTGFLGRSTRAKLNALYGCKDSREQNPRLVTPNGGEVLIRNSSEYIVWAGRPGTSYRLNLIPSVAVGLVGTKPYSIISGLSSSGEKNSYLWNVGLVQEAGATLPEGSYSVQVCDEQSGSCYTGGKFNIANGGNDIASGAVNISLDARAPVNGSVVPGAKDVLMNVIKITARDETFGLSSIALQVDGNFNYSAARDIDSISLYDGSSKIGTGVVVGSSNLVRIFPTKEFTILKDTDKSLYIRADISANAVVGDVLSINYDADGATQLVGYSSGTTVKPMGKDTFGPSMTVINPEYATTLKVVSPNGGEALLRGSNQTIKWSGDPLQAVDIMLVTYVPSCTLLSCSVPQVSYRLVRGLTSSTGQVSWTAASNMYGAYINAGKYQIKVCPAGEVKDSGCDMSDSYFTIIDVPQVANSIKVTQPNGGETYDVGEKITFRWTTNGVGQNPLTQLDIMDSRIPDWITRSLFGSEPAQNKARLVSTNGTESTFEYIYTVPANFNDSLPAQYKDIFGGNFYKANVTVGYIQTSSGVRTSMNDSSDAPFKIVNVPQVAKTIQVLSPNGGETYVAGANITFTWVAGPTPAAYIPAIPVAYLTEVYTGFSSKIPLAYNRSSDRQTGTFTAVATGREGSYIVKVCDEATLVTSDPVCDSSDTVFKILPVTPVTNSIKVTSPNGGQAFTYGQDVMITWTTRIAQYTQFQVNAFSDAGNWYALKRCSSESTYSPKAPDPLTVEYRLAWKAGFDGSPAKFPENRGWKIYVSDCASHNDESDSVFKILPVTVVNIPVVGVLDGIVGENIQGWAYDPNSSGDKIPVHLYFDGPSATGKGMAVTTETSRPDVNAAYGISGVHGFLVPIPAEYRDGKEHTVYVYGIDLTDPTGNRLLPPSIGAVGAPKTFKIGGTSALAIVEGFKVRMPGNDSGFNPPAGAKITLYGPAGSPVYGGKSFTSNPYSFGDLPTGHYTAVVEVPSGWSVGSTRCDNATSCHNLTPVSGEKVELDLVGGNRYDLWWHFTPPVAGYGGILGRIVYDTNGNGGYDAGEKFILDSANTGAGCTDVESASDFRIKIESPTNPERNVSVKPDQCNPQPNYAIVVPSGAYDVSLAVPFGWALTGQNNQKTTLDANGNSHIWFAVKRVPVAQSATSVQTANSYAAIQSALDAIVAQVRLLAR